MSMENPLHIPKSKKWKGLTVYCYKCKTNVSKICRETGKAIQSCPFGNQHAFKAYVHVPGTKNGRRTKTFKTRDVNEAIKEAIEFEKEVKGGYQPQKTQVTEKPKMDTGRPILLIEAMARDIGRLHNEDVPGHRVEERSEETIKDVERAFRLSVDCLKKSGEDMSKLRIDQLTDKMVGIIYNHMKKEKGFKNRTINKYLSHYTSFITRHNQEYNTAIPNFFETVPRKGTGKANNNKLDIIPDRATFEAFLNQVTEENGIKEYETGKKRIRNLYRPWLADAFRLALETGRRREEVLNLKFNGIVNEDDGTSYIKAENYKVNRIQGYETEDEKEYIPIPVTKSLSQLLWKLGYEKYKGTDNYILAPEIKTKRNRVMSDILSKGFSHFYSKLNREKQLTFKCLRKTYITRLRLLMGINAKAITGHSNDDVIEKWYLNKAAIAVAAKDLDVLPNDSSRKNELEQIRNNSKQNQLEMEVEK